MLTESQARALTDEIRSDAEAVYDKIVQAYEGKAHTALGYGSWSEYVATEFPLMPRLTRSDRPEITDRLQDAAMTQAEIAVTLGVSQKTVSNDLREDDLSSNFTTEINSDPEPEPLTGDVFVPEGYVPLSSVPDEDSDDDPFWEEEHPDEPIAGRNLTNPLPKQDPPAVLASKTPRSGATEWSQSVQTVSATCPMDQLTTEEVKELYGAAEFLLNYCRGELIGRKQWQ